MFVDLTGKLQVLGAARLMTVCLHTGDGFLHRSVVGQIEFEGFLLRAFGGVGPVAFRCFLHTVHIRVLSPAYPYLLEVAASFPVVQGIDGKYLLPEDAVSPRRLTNAQSARNESCVKNSCNASGRPIPRNFPHCGLMRTSSLATENGSSFFSRITTANRTLTA